MDKKPILKPYKKDWQISYSAGAYATIELLKEKPENIKAVYIHSEFTDKPLIENLCLQNGIPAFYDDKAFLRINQKENSYVLGVFEKYSCEISPEKPHIVLVNPSDMGNMGTIIRTMAGCSVLDLAVITPAADIWNPKTIRASMGALFRIRFSLFASFEDYRKRYEKHSCYPFMLDAKTELRGDNCPVTNLFSLIFGNEASGLDAQFRGIGTSYRLPQSALVDSFNVSIAAGIGIFIFSSANRLI